MKVLPFHTAQSPFTAQPKTRTFATDEIIRIKGEDVRVEHRLDQAKLERALGNQTPSLILDGHMSLDNITLPKSIGDVSVNDRVRGQITVNAPEQKVKYSPNTNDWMSSSGNGTRFIVGPGVEAFDFDAQANYGPRHIPFGKLDIQYQGAGPSSLTLRNSFIEGQTDIGALTKLINSSLNSLTLVDTLFRDYEVKEQTLREVLWNMFNMASQGRYSNYVPNTKFKEDLGDIFLNLSSLTCVGNMDGEGKKQAEVGYRFSRDPNSTKLEVKVQPYSSHKNAREYLDVLTLFHSAEGKVAMTANTKGYEQASALVKLAEMIEKLKGIDLSPYIDPSLEERIFKDSLVA